MARRGSLIDFGEAWQGRAWQGQAGHGEAWQGILERREFVKLTNRQNLPDSIVRAVANDPYQATGDISVTQLIGPARKLALYKQHEAEIEEDVTDRVWALFGQAIHTVLERADCNNDGGLHKTIREHRLRIKRHGWWISGQFDRYIIESKTLQDYKVTSTWSYKFRSHEEWERQLNIYALMLFEIGYSVDRLQVVLILRDWQQAKARTPEYPPSPIAVIDVRRWSLAWTEAYINLRIDEHKRAQQVDLPECTAEERWERPNKYAVMKGRRKTAISLHDTPGEAWQAIEGIYEKQPRTDYTVQSRAAEQVRCARYCSSAPFCEQWRKFNRLNIT